MIIRIACPKCHMILQAPTSLSGRKAQCPGCSNTFHLPDLSNNTLTNGCDSSPSISTTPRQPDVAHVEPMVATPELLRKLYLVNKLKAGLCRVAIWALIPGGLVASLEFNDRLMLPLSAALLVCAGLSYIRLRAAEAGGFTEEMGYGLFPRTENWMGYRRWIKEPYKDRRLYDIVVCMFLAIIIPATSSMGSQSKTENNKPGSPSVEKAGGG